MDLKAYQQQALETLERYLEALKDARQKADQLSALNIDALPEVLRKESAALADAAKDYPASHGTVYEKQRCCRAFQSPINRDQGDQGTGGRI